MIKLPTESLVLTTTERTEIDKVLKALVGKVRLSPIYECLDNWPYVCWNSIDTYISTAKNISYGIPCATADEFLKHFEKPTEITIRLSECSCVVFDTNVIHLFPDKNVSMITLTKDDINQINEAVKKLNG